MPKNITYNGPTYTNIPNKALEALISRGLSNTDIVVYLVLCKHYNDRDNCCWPSINTIAGFLSMDRSNVARSIRALCSAGMTLKTKTKSTNNSFDRNSYYLPHLVSFQIEKLLTEKKSAKTTKKINELRKLENTILRSVDELRGGVNMTTGSVNTTIPVVNKTKGGVKNTAGVVSGSPTNNTTINNTINIIKNVKETKDESNNDLTSSFKNLKRYDKEFSNISTEAIGNSNTLLKIKREGLVQQLASELNDEKSIPFFRSLVSKFTDHEDTIYKCLSLTRETQELAGIKTSRGAVFTDHIKREAEKLGIEM